MCMMCLIAHWTACAWHLLIVYNPDLDFVIERTGNLLDEYLDCFYGSFLLMVGDNINPQVCPVLTCKFAYALSSCFHSKHSPVGYFSTTIANRSMLCTEQRGDHFLLVCTDCFCTAVRGMQVCLIV